MNYTEFKTEIQNNIKDFLPEKFKDYDVTVRQIKKNNGITLDGLMIKGPERISPTMYLNEFFDEYEKGAELQNIMQNIAVLYEKQQERIPNLGINLARYEDVKPHLIVAVCNAKLNRGLLEDVPHDNKEDLALVYRIKQQVSDEDVGSVLVRNEFLTLWGIGEKEFKEDAWNSMRKETPSHFCSMEEVLSKIMPEEVAFDLPMYEASPNLMYVLTNETNMWGAVYMFDGKIMADIAEKLDSSFTVLPSSIHECIIVPDTVDGTAEELQEMVETVNATELREEDILSNQIYHYDRDTQELSVVPAQSNSLGMSMQM